jgi:hypothetical protein
LQWRAEGAFAAMSVLCLVQTLPDNPLDIVGDVHGELGALVHLLARLGYDKDGHHRDHRKLVFVGDLCDRGPDSYGAIRLVQHLIEQNNAYSILGNHELNLLTNDIKDGSGWFFDERYESDLQFYAPFKRVLPEQRKAVRDFLVSLPIALVRSDIRIVHAAWTSKAIDAIRNVPVGKVVEQFELWNDQARSGAEKSGLYERYVHEKKQWSAQLEDASAAPPFMHAIAEYEAAQQMVNPLKILTSGVETEATIPFFAGNRWRFSDRVNWWDDYDEPIPVVIGHYWRLFESAQSKNAPRYSQLFRNIAPSSWHGKRHNVFCVDYSVGARWRDRIKNNGIVQSRFKLAALQWPENRLVFDSGEVVETQ